MHNSGPHDEYGVCKRLRLPEHLRLPPMQTEAVVGFGDTFVSVASILLFLQRRHRPRTCAALYVSGQFGGRFLRCAGRDCASLTVSASPRVATRGAQPLSPDPAASRLSSCASPGLYAL